MGMRVLVIEDDRVTLDFIVQGLTESGHVADGADNGKDGLFRALEELYDVIIVDRMLPGLDGLALIQTLRAEGKTIPILILSALVSKCSLGAARAKALNPLLASAT